MVQRSLVIMRIEECMLEFRLWNICIYVLLKSHALSCDVPNRQSVTLCSVV